MSTDLKSKNPGMQPFLERLLDSGFTPMPTKDKVARLYMQDGGILVVVDLDARRVTTTWARMREAEVFSQVLPNDPFDAALTLYEHLRDMADRADREERVADVLDRFQLQHFNLN